MSYLSDEAIDEMSDEERVAAVLDICATDGIGVVAINESNATDQERMLTLDQMRRLSDALRRPDAHVVAVDKDAGNGKLVSIYVWVEDGFEIDEEAH